MGLFGPLALRLPDLVSSGERPRVPVLLSPRTVPVPVTVLFTGDLGSGPVPSPDVSSRAGTQGCLRRACHRLNGEQVSQITRRALYDLGTPESSSESTPLRVSSSHFGGGV